MIGLRYVLAVALAWTLVAAVAIGHVSAAEGHDRTHPAIVVCSVFGKRHCLDALKVVYCESRFSTTAQNNQYLGLFQMGSWERRTFGHGSDAWSQARAARRYFVITGRDWSPWECQP